MGAYPKLVLERPPRPGAGPFEMLDLRMLHSLRRLPAEEAALPVPVPEMPPLRGGGRGGRELTTPPADDGTGGGSFERSPSHARTGFRNLACEACGTLRHFHFFFRKAHRSHPSIRSLALTACPCVCP